MDKKIVRFGIIGAGSIGSLFGGALADIPSSNYKAETVFFSRKAHVDEINANGLTLESNQKIRKIKKIIAFENPIAVRLSRPK